MDIKNIMKKFSSINNVHKLKINFESYLNKNEKDDENEDKLFSISYPKIFSAVIIDNDSNIFNEQKNSENNLIYKSNSHSSISMKKKSPIPKKEIPDTSKKLKNLENIKNLFIDFFQGNNQIYLKNYKLDKFDYEIIFAILKKKFSYLKTTLDSSQNKIAKNSKSQKIELRSLFEKINSLKSRKRVEENNKFVYKLTLKKLRNKFYKKRNLKNNKRTELKFYSHYFEKDSKPKNRSLKDFYDPLNIKETKKTLNNSFLKLIFQTEDFRNNFFQIMNSKFRKSYLKTIPNKFVKLFEKLDLQIDDCGKEKAVFEFVKMVRKIKRLKLPWFIVEVDSAVVAFNQLINNL